MNIPLYNLSRGLPIASTKWWQHSETLDNVRNCVIGRQLALASIISEQNWGLWLIWLSQYSNEVSIEHIIYHLVIVSRTDSSGLIGMIIQVTDCKQNKAVRVLMSTANKDKQLRWVEMVLDSSTDIWWPWHWSYGWACIWLTTTKPRGSNKVGKIPWSLMTFGNIQSLL